MGDAVSSTSNFGETISSASSLGESFVARPQANEECGRLTVDEGKVVTVECNHAGSAKHVEVLVVQEVACEGELEVLRVMELGGVAYRFGDFTRGFLHTLTGQEQVLHPYVRVEFPACPLRQSPAWQAGFRDFSASHAQEGAEFNERVRFPLPLDAGGLQLKVQVYNMLDRKSMRGNPLIGEGTLSLSAEE